jgi:hypothetical protein
MSSTDKIERFMKKKSENFSIGLLTLWKNERG